MQVASQTARAQPGHRWLRLGILRLGKLKVRIVHIGQRLALDLAQTLNHKGVQRIDEVEHLQVVGPEGVKMRTALHRLHAVTKDAIDARLPFLHPLDVSGKRDKLAIGLGRLKPQQRQ